MFFNLSNYYFS